VTKPRRLKPAPLKPVHSHLIENMRDKSFLSGRFDVSAAAFQQCRV